MTGNKFKAGDRVRVFSHYGPWDGTLVDADYECGARIMGTLKGMLLVQHEDGTNWVQHPRQCVRLVKRKKPLCVMRADSAAVGSRAKFTFCMDPSIPEDEVHLRLNGRVVGKIVKLSAEE